MKKLLTTALACAHRGPDGRSAEPHRSLHLPERGPRGRKELHGLPARRLRPLAGVLPRALPTARRQRLPHRLDTERRPAPHRRRSHRRRHGPTDDRRHARRLGEGPKRTGRHMGLFRRSGLGLRTVLLRRVHARRRKTLPHRLRQGAPRRCGAVDGRRRHGGLRPAPPRTVRLGLFDERPAGHVPRPPPATTTPSSSPSPTTRPWPCCAE